MPLQLHKRIRIMKMLAVIELICVILVIMNMALIIEVSCSVRNTYLILKLCVVTCVCCFLVIGIALFRRNTDQKVIYEMHIKQNDFQSIVDVLSGEKIEMDAYISFNKVGNMSSRTLIQYCPVFDKSALSKRRKVLNRKVNQKYQVNSEVSYFKVSSMFRINLVVCDNSSAALRKWLYQNNANLLSRNESIIPVAIILDEHMLLIPDCGCGLSFNDLNRYESAVRFLCDRLEVEKETRCF